MGTRRPGLSIHADADWPYVLRDAGINREDVPYWNMTYRLGFGDRFAPRGFYSRGQDTIYVKWSARHSRRLLIHEYGHAVRYPLHDHPRTLWAGFVHAARCGFDSRAFTGLLRWRDGPHALRHGFARWSGRTPPRR